MRKTKDLNLSAYLLTRGLELTRTTHHTAVSGTWTFATDITKASKLYYQGKVTVNLATYERNRKTLKELLRGKFTEKQQAAFQAEMSGTGYWYLQDGNVLYALYGKNPIHNERKAVGNYYPTKELAELGLKHKK
jgi:hypothetical protein